jgi:hypothetical protein
MLTAVVMRCDVWWIAGFTGKKCGVNIDDCTPTAIKSCKNGSKCVDGINSYTCDCSGTKFAGPKCDQYGLSGFAQVPGGRGELFVDDDQREDDLGAATIKVKTYAMPGSTVEISADTKRGDGQIGIVASFKFRGAKLSTGSDWECSTDGGKTYRRAQVVAGRELPANVDAAAQYIWAKDAKQTAVTCRMHLPMKSKLTRTLARSPASRVRLRVSVLTRCVVALCVGVGVQTCLPAPALCWL